MLKCTDILPMIIYRNIWLVLIVNTNSSMSYIKCVYVDSCD